MNVYVNTNDAYGMRGPFEAESRESLADEIDSTFADWARDAWGKLESFDADQLDYNQFIEDKKSKMRSEFIGSLEQIS